MDIKTNLGYSFSNLKDLVQYMEEENIEEVIIEGNDWGAIVPGTKTNIETIKKIINEDI